MTPGWVLPGFKVLSIKVRLLQYLTDGHPAFLMRMIL
jgi:hypothetical protein